MKIVIAILRNVVFGHAVGANQPEKNTKTQMNTETNNLTAAAEYAAQILKLIPAFGNEIGNNISKAQLAVAYWKLEAALKQSAKL